MMTTESIDPTQNCVKEAKAMSDNVRKKAEGAPGPHVLVLTVENLVFMARLFRREHQITVK